LLDLSLLEGFLNRDFGLFRGQKEPKMKRILLLTAFATLAVAHAQTPSWTKADKSDPLLHLSFVEFTLEGKFLMPPKNSSLETPTLVVHCQPGNHYQRGNHRTTNGHFLEGWIATGAVLDTHVGDNGIVSIPVLFRLDDKKLQSDLWAPSTDHTAVYLTHSLFCGSCILNNLLYGHSLPHKEEKGDQIRKVSIGVPEYLGAEIEMPDATEVGDACGVIEHK
jgi:hypothetical protein